LQDIAAYGKYLLDEVVQIFWDFRGESSGLENTEDFVSGDETDLSNTMRISQHYTDLGWCHTPTGEFVDLFDDFGGSCFKPGWSATRVREGRGRNALAWSVHTTYIMLDKRMGMEKMGGLPMAG
jgi:hypothetical protein